MGIVVIHGPMRTGKTLHSAKFLEHYACRRVIDDIPYSLRRHGEIRDGDLLLTTSEPHEIRRLLPPVQFVPIAEARAAVGLPPIPAGGFPLPARERADRAIKGPF